MKSLIAKLKYYKGRLAYKLPTSWLLKSRYRERTGLKLNLANPVLFNEKIQWLKLNYRHKHLIQFVDKYAVREFVAQRIGEQFLIPLHGVYDSVDQIRLEDLPEQFIFKANHGSGWNIFCWDKSQFDWPAAQKTLREWLGRIYGEYRGEWAYKYVPPKIVCEKLLFDESGQVPMDYKIFCFAGKPDMIQVDQGRFTEHTRNLYDPAWNPLPIRYHYAPASTEVPKPPTLDVMLQAAATLSRDLPFARVDFYTFGQQVYFGEITLFPSGGYQSFTPTEYNRTMGDKLILPPPCRKLKL